MATPLDTRDPAWMAPFLGALGEGKGVKAAVTEARVACSTVYDRRKRDPAFAAAWDLRLRPKTLLDGRRRADKRRSSAKVERFIAKLTETSNVSAAAAHAGVTPAWVYKRRREDAEFARRWFAALAEGYDSLEMELLGRLRAGRSAKPDAQAPVHDTAAALRCLAAHRESVRREKGRRRLAEEVTTIASIDAKIDALRLNGERGMRAIAEARAANKRRSAPGF